MKRLLMTGAVVAVSLALAACGGGGGDGGSSDTGTAAANGKTVGVESMDGIGDVLVDSSGKALYASDVEADGKVQCTDACTSFWQPLTVDSGKPTAETDVGKLGVINRPDGDRQVTVDGKLVYTFSEDAPGDVEGDGFSDDFGGQHFTWNVVLAGGGMSDGGGTSDGGSSAGGYGY